MNIRYYLRDNSRTMTKSLANEVLRYPHVTEKTTSMAQARYMTFIVGKKFNKCDIKKACEILFDTEIEKVNIINQKGSMKAFKGKAYKSAGFKKAMVLFKDTEALNGMMRGDQ